MAQSTITNYFANRKRSAVEDLKGKNKVLVLDSNDHAGYGSERSSGNESQSSTRLKMETKVIVSSTSVTEVAASKPKAGERKSAAVKPKATVRRAKKPHDSKQPDMKVFLKAKVADQVEQGPSVSEDKKEEVSVTHVNLPCKTSEASGDKSQRSSDTEQKGNNQDKVSSSKEPIEHDAKSSERDPKKEIVPVPPAIESSTSANMLPPKIDQPKKESNVEKARRELSLGDIKSKLTRSARLAELKASMARFEEGRSKMNLVAQALKDEKTASPASPIKPQLNQFNSIELEVPVSPCKSPMKSPLKSPSKYLAAPRSPAFQRYSSLAQPGTPALTIPNSYRHLAELFRCVDTVVSLLFNRREVITFKKLQPAAQEMSRKSITTNHIAQMLTVLPQAYKFRQEKFHNFGSPTKNDKYQLVIEPVFASKIDEGNEKPIMTPSVLLERKRHFYNNLLNIVKKHHKEFLQTLDPPLDIPVDALTRWHPEFPLDQVPEVPKAELPQPPNQDKCCSAKDVLARARELYSCNSRVERALESVAQSNSNSAAAVQQVQNVQVEVVNPSAVNPPSSPFKSLQLSSALKGIPKALLEKVRAKQAANAVKAMTRTPAQDKEAVQCSRLPDLARILRNVFVAEKKGALLLETVIEKVGDSYHTTMSPKEIEEHLRLLAKAVPGWITFEHLLKTDYCRLSKKGDMNRVLKRLDELAKEKCGLSK